MSPKTTEAHTISFGPADYLTKQADAFITPDPINPQLPPVVSPIAAFPSEPPPAGAIESGAARQRVLQHRGRSTVTTPRR